MRMRNPIYLPFVLAVVLLAGLANHFGWSLVESAAARTLRHSGPNTQHK